MNKKILKKSKAIRKVVNITYSCNHNWEEIEDYESEIGLIFKRIKRIKIIKCVNCGRIQDLFFPARRSE